MIKNNNKLYSSLAVSLLLAGLSGGNAQSKVDNFTHNSPAEKVTSPRQALQVILSEIDSLPITEKLSTGEKIEEIPSDWENGNWFADGFAKGSR